eukprot:jgi/Mesvir1/29204/Mv08623-RA.1
MEENNNKKKRSESLSNEGDKDQWEDESAETTTINKDEDSTMARKMLGNREAVRKYRARKKALTVRLEQEVQDLRVLTGHLIYRLHRQGQVEKDIERLRSVIVEIRRRLEVPRDDSPASTRAEIASLIDDMAFDVVGACYANKPPPMMPVAPGFWPGATSPYMPPPEGTLAAPPAIKPGTCNPFSSSHSPAALGSLTSGTPGVGDFRPPPTYSFMDDASNNALLAAAAAGARSIGGEKPKLPSPMGMPSPLHHPSQAPPSANPGNRVNIPSNVTSGLGLSLSSSADSPAAKYLSGLGGPTAGASSLDSYSSGRGGVSMGIGGGSGPMGRPPGGSGYGLHAPSGSAPQGVSRMGMDTGGGMHGPGQGHPSESSMMSSHAAAAHQQRLDLGVGGPLMGMGGPPKMDMGMNPLSLGTTYSWGMTLSSGVGGCRDLNNLVDNSLNY